MYHTIRRAGLALATAATVLAGVLGTAPTAQAATDACPVIAADGSPTSIETTDNLDWSGCDLTGIDLTYWPLSSAKLAGANLTDATLTYAVLDGADLTGANLTGATMRFTNLTRATLTGANLSGTILDGVDLTNASAANVTFTDATGDRGTYEYANLTGASFTRAKLTLSDLDNAYLDRATFTDADLAGARLWSATMNNARIRATSFRDASTDSLELAGATVDAANFTRSRLNLANLTGATISNTTFDDAQIVGANVNAVTASGNTWAGAICADNQHSFTHEAGDCLRPADTTAPTSVPTVAGPGTGVNHWYTGPVSVTWNWADNGLLAATSCPTATPTTLSGTVAASCTDTAGNTGTATYVVRIDRTPPALSATVSSAPNGLNGWYRTAPTVRYTCADADSGVASCPSGITATQGARTYTVTGRDIAGNAVTNTTSVKVDSAKPAVSVNLATLNSYGAQVPKCVATDATSGLAACRITTTASTKADYRYAIATATDKAGNAAVSAKVLYRATTVAAFKSVPSTVTHGARFSVAVTSKNARGALINVTAVRALVPVKVTSTGVGPANTTLSTYATRTGTGTYKVSFTAPRTKGYYRYAVRVGNATITKVVRVV